MPLKKVYYSPVARDGMRKLPDWEKKALEKRLSSLPKTVNSKAFPTLRECRDRFGNKPPQRSVVGEKYPVDRKGHRLFWGSEIVGGAPAPIFLCIFHVSRRVKNVLRPPGRELYAVVAVSGESHRTNRDVYVLCAGCYEDFYHHLTSATLKALIRAALSGQR